MMKPSGVLSATDKTENSDAIKRLYRCASDIVRKLDKIQKNASSIEDCYQSNVQALRTRLREICERLMFLDPIGHGKKAEDLLWRKVHYEAISCAKNFRKSSSLSNSNQYWVSNHIRLGIGTYHHLLFRLQSEFQLNEGYSDFLPLPDLRGSLKEKPCKSVNSKPAKDDDIADWALKAFQRCLICMGDLARYHQELCGGNSSLTSARYYHQALLVCLQSSMPHNQLGTLVGNKNYGCDAAYFYMRCVMCNNGFEGARGNLRRIFEKNQVLLQEFVLSPADSLNEQQLRELHVKSFAVGFIQYCDFCFRYPDVDHDMPVGQLCQLIVENFRKCLDSNLSNVKSLPSVVNEEAAADASTESPDITHDYCNAETPSHLPDYLILKIFIMSLMCVEKLDMEAATSASAATALTLAAFSHLLYYILLYFKRILFGQNVESDMCSTVPDVEKLPVIVDEIVKDTPPSKNIICNSPSENSQKNTALPSLRVSRHHKRSNKSSLKRTILSHRRKRHDGLHLDDSDLSEDNATSSSEMESEDNPASDVSEGDETDGSSPCTDDDQGRDQVRVLDAKVIDNHRTDSPVPVSNSDLIAHVNNHILDSNNEHNSDSKNEDPPTLYNICITKCNLLQAGEDMKENEKLLGEDNKKEKAPDQKECLNVEKLDPTFVEQFLIADKLLPIVKLCGDWLRSNPHIITASAQGSQKLWLRYVDLMTFLALVKAILTTDDVCDPIIKKCKTWAEEDWQQTWPLPEDVISQGLPSFSDAHKTLQFETRSSVWFTEKEEVLLRVSFLQHLGFLLSKYSELGIKYDAKKEAFTFGSESVTNNTSNNHIVKRKKGKSWTRHSSEEKVQDRKKHLMHNMAQLWLEAEVKELESSVQSTGRPKFSPYLVPDSSVLLDNLHLVRQLMSAKVFIFILPITVLQCLDRMKKESIKAREAIRWLECEFQKRNRYLRAQKPHERLTLTLLKYPKRKDKEGCANFAILECAHYFARHGSASNDLSTNLVTILTTAGAGGSGGASDTSRNFYALAGTAGLKAQNIEELHTNWAAATKTQN